MSMIKKYIESGGGNWIRADDVVINDVVLVESIALDDETFDKPYICVKGQFKGVAASVRLGIQNVTRIADVLGRDEVGWVGNRLKVLGTQNYPGLGSKGILWGGEKSPPQPSTLDTVQLLSDDLNIWAQKQKEMICACIDMGLPMLSKEFNAFPLVIRGKLLSEGHVTKRDDGSYLFTEKAKTLLE